jgi:putative sigma-54 modulation protein
MKVAIRGKNIEVTDALRAYIEKRLSKLTRYFDDELDAQAVLSVVKDKSTIELTCFVDKIVLRGVETNDDMYAAIDLVVDKIVRQIHKHKTRLAKRFKKQEAFHPEVLALSKL